MSEIIKNNLAKTQEILDSLEIPEGKYLELCNLLKIIHNQARNLEEDSEDSDDSELDEETINRNNRLISRLINGG